MRKAQNVYGGHNRHNREERALEHTVVNVKQYHALIYKRNNRKRDKLPQKMIAACGNKGQQGYGQHNHLETINRVRLHGSVRAFIEAEGIDNGENLHALAIPADISAHVSHSKEFGLNTIEVEGFRYTIESGALYTRAKSHGKWIPTQIQMIPFCAFGNRGETDMLTWFHEKM